ncbi:hypothetical protein KY285_024572 [Solanum tuberosum]|nr:hypothetical protein KY285_024572 [Solanum tuberosum]
MRTFRISLSSFNSSNLFFLPPFRAELRAAQGTTSPWHNDQVKQSDIIFNSFLKPWVPSNPFRSISVSPMRKVTLSDSCLALPGSGSQYTGDFVLEFILFHIHRSVEETKEE